MQQDIRAETSVCGASARITGGWREGNNDRAQFNSMRRLLRDIAENREPGDVATLRDAPILTQLQQNAAAGKALVRPNPPSAAAR